MSALALCGGTVVGGLDPVELAAADIVIDGGRVVAVGPAPRGAARRDCSGTVVLPGNVCAHTHLYSALARGMPYSLPPPASFIEILQRIWWRLDRALDEPAVRLSALVGGLDALLAGTTTVIDHHASPNFIDGSLDVIAAALGDAADAAEIAAVAAGDGPGGGCAVVEHDMAGDVAAIRLLLLLLLLLLRVLRIGRLIGLRSAEQALQHALAGDAALHHALQDVLGDAGKVGRIMQMAP